MMLARRTSLPLWVVGASRDEDGKAKFAFENDKYGHEYLPAFHDHNRAIQYAVAKGLASEQIWEINSKGSALALLTMFAANAKEFVAFGEGHDGMPDELVSVVEMLTAVHAWPD